MRIVVDNVSCQAITGGKDNLLKINIMQQLRDYLKVKVKGYEHTQAYKNRVWDGYKPFITPKGNFATGFLPMVCKFLDDLGVQIEILDKRRNLPKFGEVVEMLPNGYELTGKFSHQSELVAKCDNWLEIQGQKLYYPRGIIDAATNAGKNSICASLYLTMGKPKTLFLIHSADIFKQAVEFFSSCFEVTQVNTKKMDFGNFTVAMVKTLYKRSKESLNIAKELKRYELLICDECHRSSADEYSKLLQKVDAGARIFVSGTPLENEDKVKNMIIIGLSGRVLGKVTNQEMIDKGVSQRPIVKFLYNSTPIARELDYDSEEKEVIQRSLTQAENILNLCIERRELGKLGVISFIDIEHGEFLQKYLNDSGKLGVVEIVHGKDRGRAKKIEAFKEGKIDVLVSSMILKEGLNIPNIHYLIRAEGGKSVITSKQFVGRAIRDDKENTTVEIIDFYHGSNSKYCSEHSMKRLKTYKKEGFEIILDPALRGIVKIKLTETGKVVVKTTDEL